MCILILISFNRSSRQNSRQIPAKSSLRKPSWFLPLIRQKPPALRHRFQPSRGESAQSPAPSQLLCVDSTQKTAIYCIMKIYNSLIVYIMSLPTIPARQNSCIGAGSQYHLTAKQYLLYSFERIFYEKNKQNRSSRRTLSPACHFSDMLRAVRPTARHFRKDRRSCSR